MTEVSTVAARSILRSAESPATSSTESWWRPVTVAMSLERTQNENTGNTHLVAPSDSSDELGRSLPEGGGLNVPCVVFAPRYRYLYQLC